MNYRSLVDLNRAIRENVYKIPNDVDLIVGIPRSGMLAANILALKLNLDFCALEAYLADVPLQRGHTRAGERNHLNLPSDARHILLVDDSIETGGSMAKALEAVHLANRNCKITDCAVYASSASVDRVKIYLEIVDQLRLFEWNLMHRDFLSQCCVDIDGVLCPDPTQEQNDDGEAYREFLRSTKCLISTSHYIGHLVSSRLEKYRAETETWLDLHGVRYGQLHLLDLPDAETRRRLNCHASFKAKVYREISASELFIESDRHQAEVIARLSGKFALSYSTQELLAPGVSVAAMTEATKKKARRWRQKLIRATKRVLFNG